MQKRAFVEHLSAVASQASRGYLVVVSMPRHAAVCKLTALSRQELEHCAFWLKLFEVVRAFVVLCTRVFR